MSYRDLVQAVDDAVSELNDKIGEYNEAVQELESTLNDNASACEELALIDDADDSSGLDHIDGGMIDAYPMERDVMAAIRAAGETADAVVRAKEELETAVTERDEYVDNLRGRFDDAMRAISGGFPDTISGEEIDEVETLVDAVERFARAAL